MTPVGIAIIGLGRVARTHIDAIQQLPDSVRLIAVIDKQEELAQSFAQEFGASPYTNLDEALGDERIEGVVVCLPHHLHHEATVKALSAGRNVLVEKVMAISVAEGQDMVRAAEVANKCLMAAHCRRFNSHLQDVRSRIDNGEIGKVLNLIYVSTASFRPENTPEWWRYENATGGLIYPMVGSHTLDVTLWMMGNRQPISVYAAGASNEPYFEGDDDATVVLKFNDGTHATNFLSNNDRSSAHGMLIIGEKGTFRVTRSGSQGGRLVGVGSIDVHLNGQLINSGETRPHEFIVQMGEFAQSIRENRQPMSSGKDALLLLEVIAAARKSSREKVVVNLK